MSNAMIYPGSLHGCVQIPPSKSAAHRAIICAALAKGKSVLSPIILSDDMTATIQAVKQMGAECNLTGETLTVDGTKTLTVPNAEIDCLESGSTLRFLIPVCAAGGMSCTFTGHGRLPERPIGIYTKMLPHAGTLCQTEGGLPLTISGKLQPGEFRLAGNVSSQFITGLMLALPLLSADSTILLTSPLESKGYVDLTIHILRQFGIEIQTIPNGWHIRGNQTYLARDYTIEGDWSQAAFFMSAAVLGGSLELKGLEPQSVQGDKAGLPIFQKLGMQAEWKNGNLLCSPGKGVQNRTIDASQIPDLVPAIAVTAALIPGVTHIINAGRLRIKESDRLASVSDGLHRLGANAEEQEDGLVIHGGSAFAGGKINGYNDHRIVMAFSVGALRADESITITDADSIKKSYPGFFEDFAKLGGKLNVI